MIQTEGNIGGTIFGANNDIKVSEKHSLFLGDLSIYCDEKDIAAAFAPYGNIVDIRIQRSKETSRALSYGFIEFDTEESAAEALREMNYFLLKGRPLRIRWAAGRTTPIKSTITPHDSAATVYVRFLTLEDNVEITEESLRTLFNQYGPVFDCAIKKLAQEQKGTRIKGYAFISFDSGALAKGSVDVVGVEAALRVCTELRNRVVDNVRYRCELGNRLQKQAASMSMAPTMLPTVVPAVPLGGYYPAVSTEYAPVPQVAYTAQGPQPLPEQHQQHNPHPHPQVHPHTHQHQVPYQQPQQQQFSSGSTDGHPHVYSPSMLSPYSSNPSTPTNHQLRMTQLAQQQQQLHISYQQQQQQYQQQYQQQQIPPQQRQQQPYHAPHPGYTPMPTPTNQNTLASAGTALQVLQQQPPCHSGQQSQLGVHTKHPQDQHHSAHQAHQGQGQGQSHSHGHSHSHTPNHGQGHGHGHGQGHNSNYQAQLLAQAQAQLQAQALAQAALHAQQAQQIQQAPMLPPQYVQCPPQVQQYLSRGNSGYNSGAATPVSSARMALSQPPQYGQMVTTPDGMVVMVPVSVPMSVQMQMQGSYQTQGPGLQQGMHHPGGYPPHMPPQQQQQQQQQAFTPRAYTPTAYAQQQAYLHQGHTTPRSLHQHQQYHHQQQQQQQTPPQAQQTQQLPALQQHATQQQGILKELSCSQYFAQKGIRLSIKTNNFEESALPVAPPRSHSADNTPREAYLQRKMNITPRRTPYNNNLYTNYNNNNSNNGSSNSLYERNPVSRRGSNDSVNTTSLYLNEMSIDEAPEYAESTHSSEKCEKVEVDAETPTTGTIDS